MAQGDRAHLLAQASFVGTWGYLLQAGVNEEAILGLLSEQAATAELRELAAAGKRALARGRSLGSVVEQKGGSLSFWVQVLLGGERAADVLTAAAELLLEEAREPWSKARLWRKLRLLHEARAPVGEALGALAREARDHEQRDLGEAFYAAAREGRRGADLRQALRRSSGFPPAERLALQAASGLAAALEALVGLAAVQEAAGPEGATSLEHLAAAASERAAPLKRGFERMLSGIEGALGIDRPPERATSLARETIEARAQRPPSPTREAPSRPPPPASPSPGVQVQEADFTGRGAPSRKKTIGPDSRPIRIGDAIAAAELKKEEEWVLALEDARAKLTLIEVQPAESGLADELRGELETLRSELLGLRHRDQHEVEHAKLLARFAAWEAGQAD